MIEKRKNIRFRTLAKAKIEGSNDKETVLTDLSVLGCRVECVNHPGIEVSKQYKLDIIPEHISKVGSFYLLVESEWIRDGDDTCEAGFSIVESPKGKLFQRYLDYLSWRSSRGEDI